MYAVQSSLKDLIIRPPTVDDAQKTLELMLRCDVSEYGEPMLDSACSPG
jgi:hypothetical protein